MSEKTEFAKQLAQAQPTTCDLVRSVLLDTWPNAHTITDFGLDSQKHYEALYYPIRNQEITPAQLDDALSNGEKITGLIRAAPSNPHKDVIFETSWDNLLGRDWPPAHEIESYLREIEAGFNRSADDCKAPDRDKDCDHER